MVVDEDVGQDQVYYAQVLVDPMRNSSFTQSVAGVDSRPMHPRRHTQS